MRLASRAYAVIGLGLTIAVAIGAVVLRIADPAPIVPNTFGFGDLSLLSFLILGVAFAAVGAILVVRLPANAVGWVMVLVGVCHATAAFMAAVVFSAVADGPSAAGLARAAAWIAVLTSTTGGAFIILAVIFPDGRGPTPAWDRVLRAVLVAAPIVLTVAIFARPGPLQLFPSIDNPVGIGPDLRPWFGPSPSEGVAAFAALLAPLMVWALVVRYRRSGAVERLQLRWFALSLAASGSAIAGTALVAAVVGRPPEVGLALFGIFGALVPVSIGMAILRYRLYDLDRIISQTLTYVVLSVVLFGVFAGVNLVLQGLISPLIGGNAAATAVSTLVVAALFDPARTRIQRAMDRRFHRARYDAERTIAGFAGRLRDELDLATLTQQLRDAAADAVDPASTVVWLRQDGEVSR